MKKIFLLLFLPCVMFGQSNISNKVEYAKTFRLGTQILNLAYVANQSDTSQIVKCSDYTSTFVTVQSKDSASIHIKYQLSVDGVTWGTLNTQDSLSTASNTGDVKSLNMSTIALGANYIRYVFNQTAFRVGTSSATYTALIVNRRY